MGAYVRVLDCGVIVQKRDEMMRICIICMSGCYAYGIWVFPSACALFACMYYPKTATKNWWFKPVCVCVPVHGRV